MLTPAQADDEDRRRPPDPKPPLGSWTAMYIAVLVIQIVLVIVFVWFQNSYR